MSVICIVREVRFHWAFATHLSIAELRFVVYQIAFISVSNLHMNRIVNGVMRPLHIIDSNMLGHLYFTAGNWSTTSLLLNTPLSRSEGETDYSMR